MQHQINKMCDKINWMVFFFSAPSEYALANAILLIIMMILCTNIAFYAPNVINARVELNRDRERRRMEVGSG